MMDLNRIVDDAKYWMLTNTLPIRTLTQHHCSDGRFARKPGLACSPQFLRPFTPEKNLWKKSSCSATYVCWQRGNVHICPVLLQQSIDISCVPGLQQEICCSRFAAVGPCCDRQTDRQMDRSWSDRHHTVSQTLLCILCKVVPISGTGFYSTTWLFSSSVTGLLKPVLRCPV